MTNDLQFYQSNGSPNSRRVRIYLAERGISVTTVPIDLGAKEQFSDSYKAINPRQVVPTLVLADGTSIGEVPAIIRYLDEAYNDNPIGGTTPAEKALVTMWERRVELEGFAVVMEIVRNKVAGLAGRALSGPHAYDQIPAIVERGKLRLRDFFADLEERLAANQFVAGERFSTADITALVTIDFAKGGLEVSIPEANVATRRWYDAVSNRPSASA
ncbi:glutathione S-transferase [Rhizobium phaseoli]|uniref:glutathione S-transferase family protein n=1 Tax=Rhizobium phaseoli TaxID=396 RepID=UPI000D676461|nr:glutathione S-transferase [Rhizobium phaseoli]PWI49799.1 glutathione S-transferase [Rhizobium phaseoli]